MTTTPTTEPTTATPCPSWCTTPHLSGPGAFHAGPDVADGITNPVRLWQADHDGSQPGVVVAGELLTDAQAHELGMALVRAADVLRRDRMAANR